MKKFLKFIVGSIVVVIIVAVIAFAALCVYFIKTEKDLASSDAQTEYVSDFDEDEDIYDEPEESDDNESGKNEAGKKESDKNESDKNEDKNKEKKDTEDNSAELSDSDKVNSDAKGVDPELKEFLDSYEEFIDEYVDFLKEYESDSANAVTMIVEYGEIMKRYYDFAEAIEAYDEEEMSTEDMKYYLDVVNRCNQKILELQ